MARSFGPLARSSEVTGRQDEDVSGTACFQRQNLVEENNHEIQLCTLSAAADHRFRSHYGSFAGTCEPLFQCGTVGKLGLYLHRTIFTPGGPLPSASDGHFNQDAAG